MTIPHHRQVRVSIKFNGVIHEAIGREGDSPSDRSSVCITKGQFPSGCERDPCVGEMEYVFGTRCLVPDPTGKCARVATEVFDLDMHLAAEKIEEAKARETVSD